MVTKKRNEGENYSRKQKRTHFLGTDNFLSVFLHHFFFSVFEDPNILLSRSALYANCLLEQWYE